MVFLQEFCFGYLPVILPSISLGHLPKFSLKTSSKINQWLPQRYLQNILCFFKLSFRISFRFQLWIPLRIHTKILFEISSESFQKLIHRNKNGISKRTKSISDKTWVDFKITLDEQGSLKEILGYWGRFPRFLKINIESLNYMIQIQARFS